MARIPRVIYPTEDDKYLMKAMLGRPYFLVVQNPSTVDIILTEDLDTEHIFKWIADMADHSKEFRDKLPDRLIELSKHV